MILTHFSFFWVVCHLNKTFSPKEFERESHNRLPHSPHRQTIPSLTFDPWPTTLVLAGYKWVSLGLVHAPLPYESMACLLFMRLPLPAGLSSLAVHFAAYFLTLCGMDELLDLHSLHLVSSLGWVLLGHGPFLL